MKKLNFIAVVVGLCGIIVGCGASTETAPKEVVSHAREAVITTPVGQVQHIAGNAAGLRGHSMEFVPTSDAYIDTPRGLAINPIDGKLYMSDTGSNRVVRVESDRLYRVVSGQWGAGGITFYNLLANPGAETPGAGTPSGWTLWSGSADWSAATRPAGATAMSPPEALNGDNVFRPGAGTSARLVQKLTIPPEYSPSSGSARFRFTGYVRSTNEGTLSDEGQFVVQYRNSSGSVLYSFTSPGISNTTGWLQVVDEHVAPAGTTQIWVNLIAYKNVGPDYDVYFDGLSLRVLPWGMSTLGDGASATEAVVDGPQGLAFDSNGVLYVADSNNNRIRRVDLSGNITSFGTGAVGSANGAAASATFNYPTGVAVDSSNNLWVADSGNHLIRKITSPATASATVVPVSIVPASGPATLLNPLAIAIDPYNGDPWIADRSNFRVLRGSTVLGSGRGRSEAPLGSDGSSPLLFGRLRPLPLFPGSR